MELANKVAVVTGASAGIGLEVAKILAARGVKVALVARSQDKLKSISAALPGSIFIIADLSKTESINDLIAKVINHFGRLDILINNAGQGYYAGIKDIEPANFRHIFELNLMAPLQTMQAVIPQMKKQGGGSIINISSGTALMFIPQIGAYSSLKRALVGLSLTARHELRADHIIVSVAYPYITETAFEKNALKAESLKDLGEIPPGDNASYIAEKIVAGIISGEPQIYAHDWMAENAKKAFSDESWY